MLRDGDVRSNFELGLRKDLFEVLWTFNGDDVGGGVLYRVGCAYVRYPAIR